jgi:uncharacterized protein YjdB
VFVPARLTTLIDATPSGTWSSSNSAIVSMASAIVATGVAAGTATITYTLGSCFATYAFTAESDTLLQ